VPAFSVTFGAYEVNQGLYTDPYYRSGFKFDGAKDSGVYCPVEFAWTPSFGPDTLPGHYKIGAGYDTFAGYKDFGNALAAASVPGFTARSRRGNTQFWALADQMLLRHGPGRASGIIALLGLIHNDRTTRLTPSSISPACWTAAFGAHHPAQRAIEYRQCRAPWVQGACRILRFHAAWQTPPPG